MPRQISCSQRKHPAAGGRTAMGKMHAKQHARRLKRKRNRIPGYTDEVATAAELNVSVRTLRKWRKQGVGPPYVKVARQIHYADQSRAAWLKAREIQPIRSLDQAMA
jgi:hypothetical protein